jgi:hypothetical protein
MTAKTCFSPPPIPGCPSLEIANDKIPALGLIESFELLPPPKTELKIELAHPTLFSNTLVLNSVRPPTVLIVMMKIFEFEVVVAR